MNQHNKFFLTALLISAMHTYAEKPKEEALLLKPKTSALTNILTAGTGLTAGALTLYGLSSFFSDTKEISTQLRVAAQAFVPFQYISFMLGIGKDITLKTDNPKIISGLITTASVAVGAFAAWLMYRYQPEGKYSRAHSALAQAINDEILNELIDAEQSLIENINNEYIEFAYPRVSACNDFINYRKSLNNAVTLFKEAMYVSGDQELIEMAQECISIIQMYVPEIERCINIIRNEPDWIEQLKGHDTMLARQAQERTALATQQLALNSSFPQTVIVLK